MQPSARNAQERPAWLIEADQRLDELDRLALYREATGATLRQLRARHKLTQAKLAQEAGISRNYLGELERARHNVSFATVLALANALGVTLEEFLRVFQHRYDDALAARAAKQRPAR